MFIGLDAAVQSAKTPDFLINQFQVAVGGWVVLPQSQIPFHSFFSVSRHNIVSFLEGFAEGCRKPPVCSDMSLEPTPRGLGHIARSPLVALQMEVTSKPFTRSNQVCADFPGHFLVS